jgi:hypothetical protein
MCSGAVCVCAESCLDTYTDAMKLISIYTNVYARSCAEVCKRVPYVIAYVCRYLSAKTQTHKSISICLARGVPRQHPSTISGLFIASRSAHTTPSPARHREKAHTRGPAVSKHRTMQIGQTRAHTYKNAHAYTQARITAQIRLRKKTYTRAHTQTTPMGSGSVAMPLAACDVSIFAADFFLGCQNASDRLRAFWRPKCFDMDLFRCGLW